MAAPLAADVVIGLPESDVPRLAHWIDAEEETTQFAEETQEADREALHWQEP